MTCNDCQCPLNPKIRTGYCRRCYERRRCLYCSRPFAALPPGRTCQRCRSRPRGPRKVAVRQRLVPPGHDERIALYRRRASLRLPLFETSP
jgi:hypothetical protein